MSLKVAGTIAGREVVTFKYTDKKTGKQEDGKRASIFILDGGRPVEVAVAENYGGKVGDKVELPVYVSVYSTKNGGAGFRLVHLKG